MSNTIQNNEVLPRILIESDLPFSNLGNFVKERKIEIDRRSILGEGNEKFASPLSEYDLLILDFHDKIANVSNNRREHLINFLKNGKPIIYLLRKFYHRNLNFNNYILLKLILDSSFPINTKDIGNKFYLTKEGKASIFKNYLDGAKKEYKISAGDPHNQVISLANNTEENSIAFISKKYKTIYFLPWLEENSDEFEKIILDLAYESLKSGEQVENWVKDYSFNSLKNVNDVIAQFQNNIATLEREKNIKISEKENYEKIRDTLLYRDGKILEDITKEVLNSLGLDVNDGKIGHEDIRFLINGNHFVVEVKGTTKSCKKNEHVGQLKNHISDYETENETIVKGILIINAWREKPIEERDKEDTKIFPPESVKVAEISNIVLMTTQQLFVAYCQHLDGTFGLEDFINKITNTIGVFEGYDNIEEYKIKTEEIKQ